MTPCSATWCKCWRCVSSARNSRRQRSGKLRCWPRFSMRSAIRTSGQPYSLVAMLRTERSNSMTESRGAMTAQQFAKEVLKWPASLQNTPENIFRFADALSAHNTAQLTETIAHLEIALDNERKSWRISDAGHANALRRAEKSE